MNEQDKRKFLSDYIQDNTNSEHPERKCDSEKTADELASTLLKEFSVSARRAMPAISCQLVDCKFEKQRSGAESQRKS